MHRQLCRPHDLIDKVLNIASADARHANVIFETDYMADAPQVELDAVQIQQVFLNLVINAIQAMPEGGTLKIRTRAPEENKKIAIEISDTGVGIPENQKDRIFDPFYTTKP